MTIFISHVYSRTVPVVVKFDIFTTGEGFTQLGEVGGIRYCGAGCGPHARLRVGIYECIGS